MVNLPLGGSRGPIIVEYQFHGHKQTKTKQNKTKQDNTEKSRTLINFEFISVI